MLLLFAETSKVPFYILGGLLAVWAVVLGVVGLNRDGFPGSERGARGVMTVSFVMIVLAIGSAVATG